MFKGLTLKDLFIVISILSVVSLLLIYGPKSTLRDTKVKNFKYVDTKQKDFFKTNSSSKSKDK